jgi:hypothetical protein
MTDPWRCANHHIKHPHTREYDNTATRISSDPELLVYGRKGAGRVLFRYSRLTALALYRVLVTAELGCSALAPSTHRSASTRTTGRCEHVYRIPPLMSQHLIRGL